MIHRDSLALGIFGAGGLVGEELRSLLATRGFPLRHLHLFGNPSGTTAGSSGGNPGEDPPTTPYDDSAIEVFKPSSPPALDLAFLATPAEAARALAPALVDSGCRVIDCSSAHRADAGVPLILPEINAALLESAPRLVSSPNCTTTIALLAIEPIRRLAGLRRLRLCSYQAVSGAGRAGLEELDRQIRESAAGAPPAARHFASPILCNLFCHESAEDEFGENDEERKIREESRRILEMPDLPVAATCVRVATRRAHAIAISIETEQPVGLSELVAGLDAAEGLHRVDSGVPSEGSGRRPLRLQPLDAEGRDEVLVGRVRPDRSGPEGRAWSLFVVGDQLRKGAALNAIQIAEAMTGAKRGL